MFHVGDEWTDGPFNYIIVKVEDVLTADETAVVRFVTVFDGEGVVDRYPESVHDELVNDESLDWTLVDEPLNERLDEWRKNHPDFPL